MSMNIFPSTNSPNFVESTTSCTTDKKSRAPMMPLANALGSFEQTWSGPTGLRLPGSMAARVRPLAVRQALLDYMAEATPKTHQQLERWDVNLGVPRIAAVIGWEPVYRYRQEEQKNCIDVFQLWERDDDIIVQLHDWLWLVLKTSSSNNGAQPDWESVHEDFQEFAQSATGKNGLVSMGVGGWHSSPDGLRMSAAEAVRAARWAHWFCPVGGLCSWEDPQWEDALDGAAFAQASPEQIDCLKALEPRPDWSQTLRIYLHVQRDALRTGRILSVHQNTIDYRLACSAQAMGLDPRDGREAALLRSAMAAYVLAG